MASDVRNGTFRGNFIPRVVKRIIASKKREGNYHNTSKDPHSRDLNNILS